MTIKGESNTRKKNKFRQQSDVFITINLLHVDKTLHSSLYKYTLS